MKRCGTLEELIGVHADEPLDFIRVFDQALLEHLRSRRMRIFRDATGVRAQRGVTRAMGQQLAQDEARTKGCVT